MTSARRYILGHIIPLYKIRPPWCAFTVGLGPMLWLGLTAIGSRRKMTYFNGTRLSVLPHPLMNSACNNNSSI